LTPESGAVNVTTPVVYSITVHNDGPAPAKAVAIEGTALSRYIVNASLAVSSDDAIVESISPLKVSVPLMPAGATVTIDLSADAPAPTTAARCVAGPCPHAAARDCGPRDTPVEIAGDRTENDGDARVGWEDPDGCDQLLARQPKRVMLRRPAAGGRNRLRVKA